VDLPGVRGWVAAHLEGQPGEVATRVRAVRRTLGGDATERREPPSGWGRYPFLDGGAALRLTVPPEQVHALAYVLRDAVGGVVAVRGCAGAGVLHAGLPATCSPRRVRDVLSAVRATLPARGGMCSLLWAPPEVRRIADPPDGHGAPMTLPVLAKTWFDPGRRFVPGRIPSVP
jgi:glycolate oxidase FAD binding subunit